MRPHCFRYISSLGDNRGLCFLGTRGTQIVPQIAAFSEMNLKPVLAVDKSILFTPGAFHLEPNPFTAVAVRSDSCQPLSRSSHGTRLATVFLPNAPGLIPEDAVAFLLLPFSFSFLF